MLTKEKKQEMETIKNLNFHDKLVDRMDRALFACWLDTLSDINLIHLLEAVEKRKTKVPV